MTRAEFMDLMIDLQIEMERWGSVRSPSDGALMTEEEDEIVDVIIASAERLKIARETKR